MSDYDDPLDQLVLVDENDSIVGYANKSRCHDGAGIRHRAFSVFIFDDQQRLLIHQRAPAKRLWGGYWTNSCCSHPRRDEEITAAAKRRVAEELGMDVDPRALFKFEYQAEFDDKGSEWELCTVLLATSSASVNADPNEISAFEWHDLVTIDGMIQSSSRALTPWFIEEWQTIREHHQKALRDLFERS
jgi:isopentenyl-diphosphate Delta-isomerase